MRLCESVLCVCCVLCVLNLVLTINRSKDSAECAVQAINQVPYLQDISNWLQWEDQFSSAVGDLESFLLDQTEGSIEGYILAMPCASPSKQSFVRVEMQATVHDLCQAVTALAARETVSTMLSLLLQNGGMTATFPVALVRHQIETCVALIKSETHQPEHPPSEHAWYPILS